MAGYLNGGALNTGELNGLGGPTFETYSLSVPISLVLIDTRILTIPLSITGLSMANQLSIPLAVVVFQNFSLSVPLSLQVRDTQLQLSIPITLHMAETFALSIPTYIQVHPDFASGIGGQGVGQVVQLPVNQVQPWTLKVLMGGVDISARLTGELNIDAEENSAVVAMFSIRPIEVIIDPYSWVKAPVEIYYTALDPTGVIIGNYLVFKGIVDTPIYDTTSRVTEFTCTDDLQNTVMRMSHAAVDLLTPLSVWSGLIYDEAQTSWDYLQTRLKTYPYAVNLDINGVLKSYDWRSSTIAYEFNANVITEGSLTVSIANARDIVNYSEVTLDVQYDQYRESITRFRWEDQKFNDDRDFPNWWMCSAQMVLDAVNGVGCTWVSDPLVGVQPQSHGAGTGPLQWVQVNPGLDLTVVKFMGSFSKRWSQSILEQRVVVVQDTASVLQLGQLPLDMTGSVSVEYNTSISTAFDSKIQNTKWYCSAGDNYQEGRSTDSWRLGDPMLVINNGWINYPRFSATYETWDDSFFTDLHSHKYAIIDGIVTPTTEGFDQAGSTPYGEFFYDFNDYIISGTTAEQTLALSALEAEAKVSILASHRQNRVGFTTFIQPFLTRGMTLRVSTPTLVATGKLYHLSHVFDIEQGTALTNVTLAVSSTKAIGISDVVYSNVKLTIPIEIKVTKAVSQSTLPVDQTSINYSLYLLTYYEPNDLEFYPFDGSHWGGFFTKTVASGDTEFVLEYPGLSTVNTANTDIVVQGDMINVNVPNDELFLFA